MSLKRNLVANYASQAYVTVAAIVMVPVYIRLMGVEAYGLIGFFAMVQVCFQLIDAGIVPTIGRETARFASGATSALRLRQLLHSLERLFVVLAIAGAAAVIFAADAIASDWLKVETLPHGDVVRAVQLMGLTAALRWGSELYRGIIAGFERLVWLGQFNAAIATARFILVVPVLLLVGTGPREFFVYQLAVAAIELAVVSYAAYRWIPPRPPGTFVHSLQPLRDVAGFSIDMATATLAWILVANLDKLLLTSLLTLAQYGRFTLAVLAASGVLAVAGPIGGALMPRLTALHARQELVAERTLYAQATEWVGIVVWPACAILALGAEQVLLLWTGDAALAKEVAPTLTLYALGNGFLAMAAFAFYLQFAQGRLRLHLIGSGLFLVLLVPLVVVGCRSYGPVGAGFAWLFVNLLYFLAWVPVVHRRYLPGFHKIWLLRSVLPIALLSFMAATVIHVLAWPPSRELAGLQLLVISCFVLLAASFGSGWLRQRVRRLAA